MREALTARFILKGNPEPLYVRRVEIQALTLSCIIYCQREESDGRKITIKHMNPLQVLGKATEMLVGSMLLKDQRELYQPVVDDHGVDLIVRTNNFDPTADIKAPEHYEFQEIQVKSVKKGGLFAAITMDPHPNYWLVFYIQNIDKMWLINSMDIVNHDTINDGLKSGDAGYIGASQNKAGKYVGKWSVDLKPVKRTPIKSADYLITDFSRLP